MSSLGTSSFRIFLVCFKIFSSCLLSSLLSDEKDYSAEQWMHHQSNSHNGWKIIEKLNLSIRCDQNLKHFFLRSVSCRIHTEYANRFPPILLSKDNFCPSSLPFQSLGIVSFFLFFSHHEQTLPLPLPQNYLPYKSSFFSRTLYTSHNSLFR